MLAESPPLLWPTPQLLVWPPFPLSPSGGPASGRPLRERAGTSKDSVFQTAHMSRTHAAAPASVLLMREKSARPPPWEDRYLVSHTVLLGLHPQGRAQVALGTSWLPAANVLSPSSSSPAGLLQAGHEGPLDLSTWTPNAAEGLGPAVPVCPCCQECRELPSEQVLRRQ